MCSILIIEDDTSTAEALAALLNHAGHEVVGVAVDMTSALHCAALTKPEVLLADIVLAHGSDGIETARRIRVHLPVKVVFMSANHDLQTRQRAAEVSGSVGFLAKPFLPKQLLAMLNDSRF